MRNALLLLASCIPVYLGFSLSKSESVSLYNLAAILELLRHVRRQISSFLTRRADLCMGFESEALEKCGFLPCLRFHREAGHKNPLFAALDAEGERLALGSEDLRSLTEYARHLGECDAEEEVARLMRLEGYLEERYQKQREETGQKVRLYRAFGVVGGLTLLLILW